MGRRDAGAERSCLESGVGFHGKDGASMRRAFENPPFILFVNIQA